MRGHLHRLKFADDAESHSLRVAVIGLRIRRGCAYQKVGKNHCRPSFCPAQRGQDCTEGAARDAIRRPHELERLSGANVRFVPEADVQKMRPCSLGTG